MGYSVIRVSSAIIFFYQDSLPVGVRFRGVLVGCRQTFVSSICTRWTGIALFRSIRSHSRDSPFSVFPLPATTRTFLLPESDAFVLKKPSGLQSAASSVLFGDCLY
jgi:hypothetical protein